MEKQDTDSGRGRGRGQCSLVSCGCSQPVLPLYISLTTIRSLHVHPVAQSLMSCKPVPLLRRKAPHARVLRLLNFLSFSSAVSAARGAQQLIFSMILCRLN